MDTKCWILIFIAIAVVAIAVHFCITRSVTQTLIARVHQDGNLIYTFDLANVAPPFTFGITSQCGGENILLIEPNQISVTAASCPDLLCVRQGTITNRGLPIVCLPHRLVIEITGAAEHEIDILIR